MRVAAELAAATPKEPVKGERLATAQDIPLKFLENILGSLRTAGIVASKRGAEGGYLLAQAPAQVTVADVIRAVDGPLGAVRGEPPEDLTYPGPAKRVVDVWIAARAEPAHRARARDPRRPRVRQAPGQDREDGRRSRGPAPPVTDDHELAARVAHDAGQLLLALRETSDDSGDAPGSGRRAGERPHPRRAAARPGPTTRSSRRSRPTTSARLSRGPGLDRRPARRHPRVRREGPRRLGRARRARHRRRGRDRRGRAPGPGPRPRHQARRPTCPRRGDGPIRLVVSRTRPPAVTDKIQAALDAELVPMGSAGAKTMAIVLGDADVYAHAGGQYQWDSAAPVAVARAAGLHTSRLDGSPLRYNEADTVPPRPPRLPARARRPGHRRRPLDTPGDRARGSAPEWDERCRGTATIAAPHGQVRTKRR